jgi:hypothetical protein
MLFEACAAGDVESVQRLLQDPANVAKATKTELHVLNATSMPYKHPRLNLAMMFREAAAASSTDTVEYLHSFAKSHAIPYDTLVNRESIIPAFCSANSVAVSKKILTVRPDSVDQHMSHAGRPLTQAIVGPMNAPRYTSDGYR